MARDEPAAVGHERAPARPGAGWGVRVLRGGGVKTDPGDLDERVARVGVDRDPVPRASVAPAHHLSGVHRSADQPGSVEYVGSRPGAVIAGVVPGSVPSTVDVGLVADPVACPDRALYLNRRVRRRIREPVDDLRREAPDDRMLGRALWPRTGRHTDATGACRGLLLGGAARPRGTARG